MHELIGMRMCAPCLCVRVCVGAYTSIPVLVSRKVGLVGRGQSHTFEPHTAVSVSCLSRFLILPSRSLCGSARQAPLACYFWLCPYFDQLVLSLTPHSTPQSFPLSMLTNSLLASGEEEMDLGDRGVLAAVPKDAHCSHHQHLGDAIGREQFAHIPSAFGRVVRCASCASAKLLGET